jgi:hypothetical protein
VCVPIHDQVDVGAHTRPAAIAPPCRSRPGLAFPSFWPCAPQSQPSRASALHPNPAAAVKPHHVTHVRTSSVTELDAAAFRFRFLSLGTGAESAFFRICSASIALSSFTLVLVACTSGAIAAARAASRPRASTAGGRAVIARAAGGFLTGVVAAGVARSGVFWASSGCGAETVSSCLPAELYGGSAAAFLPEHRYRTRYLRRRR